uniref:Ski_Sno domain-containing protein n=1 Tax=Steinernema glaseri TaxID=37863 RepID=A0A1I7YN52_9BILA
MSEIDSIIQIKSVPGVASVLLALGVPMRTVPQLIVMGGMNLRGYDKEKPLGSDLPKRENAGLTRGEEN